MTALCKKSLNVLLLSAFDDAVSLERSALRQAGITRVRSLRGGRMALELLERNAENKDSFHIDVVVCAAELSDMDAGVFLSALTVLRHKFMRQGVFEASQGAELLPPVLVISPDASMQKNFLAQGAGAVLSRPYSIAALERNINKIGSVAARSIAADSCLAEGEAGFSLPGFSLSGGRDFDKPLQAAATDSFFAKRQIKAQKKLPALPLCAAQNNTAAASLPEPVVDAPALHKTVELGENLEKVNPLLFTSSGLKLMRAGNLSGAERFLRRALQYDRVDLEAALGLAGICKKNGDRLGEQRWTNCAALICLKTKQPERAKILLAGLPKEQTENPYLSEARSLFFEKAYDEAAEAFVEAYNYQSEQPLHALIARVCQFTECPEQNLGELCAAYSRIGQPHIAANLYRRLLNNKDAESEDHVSESFLARFPRLYEIVEVARYTMQAWRRAETSGV